MAKKAAAIATGVGYTPATPISQFKLDNVNSSYRAHPMDLTAQAYGPTGSGPAEPVAFELRYGAGTSGPRMKGFIGPNNEMRGIVANALAWKFGGTPSEQEVTDVQATGDASIWQPYLVAEGEGWRPDNRIRISDSSLPHGNGERFDRIWSMTQYFFNEAEAPVDPPVDPPEEPPTDPVDPPDPPVVCPPAWRKPPIRVLEILERGSYGQATKEELGKAFLKYKRYFDAYRAEHPGVTFAGYE